MDWYSTGAPLIIKTSFFLLYWVDRWVICWRHRHRKNASFEGIYMVLSLDLHSKPKGRFSTNLSFKIIARGLARDFQISDNQLPHLVLFSQPPFFSQELLTSRVRAFCFFTKFTSHLKNRPRLPKITEIRLYCISCQ